MDFKSRFAGKMSKISADGGIEEVVASSSKPIQKDERITHSGLTGGPQNTTGGYSVKNTTGSNYSRKPVSFGGGLGG